MLMSKSNVAIAILIVLNGYYYLKRPENAVDFNQNSGNNTTTSEHPMPATIGRFTPKYDAKNFSRHPLIKKGSHLESVIVKARNIKLNFNRLIDIDFEFLMTPKQCRKDLLLVVMVSSKPDNFDRRRSIRDTWGSPNEVTQVVFALGIPVNDKNDTNQMKITKESKLYGDIVQGNFGDSYRNLTYKHMMGIQWVAEFCRSPRFVLKTDDDTFVNYDELVWFLNKEFYDWGDKYAMACALQTGMPVSRNEKDFWYVTHEEFDRSSYPPFCSGSFILYATEVLPALIQESLSTKYFYVDDVYVTGFLTEKLNLTQINIEYLFLNTYTLHQLITKGPGDAGTFLTGPMNVDVPDVYMMWKVLKKNPNELK